MWRFWSSSGGGNSFEQADTESSTAASDTPMINRDITSEQSLGFLFLRLDRHADVALAVAAEESVGIDAGVVAVAPRELQGIAPHRLSIVQADEHRNVIGHQPKLTGPFIRAGRAGTMQPQVADRIDTLV